MYRLTFSPSARKDLLMLQKKAPTAMKKLRTLLAEIVEHPRSGTGQCEQLKHYKMETWSRRIVGECRYVFME